jgi:DNA-directed RNA polymerase alpha subunit
MKEGYWDAFPDGAKWAERIRGRSQPQTQAEADEWAICLLSSVFGEGYEVEVPNDLYNTVSFAFSKLTEKEQIALETRYLEKKTYKEIGSIIVATTTAAMKVTQNAAKKFRYCFRFRRDLEPEELIFVEEFKEWLQECSEYNDRKLAGYVKRYGSADIRWLGLNFRLCERLKRAGVMTVDELYKQPVSWILGLRSIGDMSMSQIQQRLMRHGFVLYDDSNKPLPYAPISL